MGLSVLYIGDEVTNSGQRLQALRRLGHSVDFINQRTFLPQSKFVESWIWHAGGIFLEDFYTRNVTSRIPKGKRYDIAWINHGELVGSTLVRKLKQVAGKVVNFNADDPYGNRDARKWNRFLRTLPDYDLVALVRPVNVEEAIGRGAKKVICVGTSADEVAHAPRPISEADRLKWSSEVGFVGTWMPERGPFFESLIKLKVPLSIWGNRWQKAAEWPVIEPHWRGPSLDNADDYAKAIQCSKVCLGLVSKGNRDTATTRTFEIPYLGGLFCAERTPDHLSLYKEDEEALYWNSPEECAEKCAKAIAKPGWRNEIAAAGRLRCIANGTLNEPVITKVLNAAMG